MINWIKQNPNKTELSNPDKLKQLLKIENKLVLIQFDELTKLSKLRTLHNKDTDYIERLYNHYIVKGFGKSYNYTD